MNTCGNWLLQWPVQLCVTVSYSVIFSQVSTLPCTLDTISDLPLRSRVITKVQHLSPRLRSAWNSIYIATSVLRVLPPRQFTQQGQSWNHYFSWPTLLLLLLASELMASPSKLRIFSLSSVLPSSYLPSPLNCLSSCLRFNIILVSWPHSSPLTAWAHTHILPRWNLWIGLSVGALAFSFPCFQSPLCGGINTQCLTLLIFFRNFFQDKVLILELYRTLSYNLSRDCCFSFNSCHLYTLSLLILWVRALLTFQFSKQNELFYVSLPLYMYILLLWLLFLFCSLVNLLHLLEIFLNLLSSCRVRPLNPIT